jgi:hypothetical protein
MKEKNGQHRKVDTEPQVDKGLCIRRQTMECDRCHANIEPQALVKELGGQVTQKELEREFAALRHMEKARGEKRGDRIVWRLW